MLAWLGLAHDLDDGEDAPPHRGVEDEAVALGDARAAREPGAAQELGTLVEPVLGQRPAGVADGLEPVARLSRPSHRQRVSVTVRLRVRALPAASVAVARSMTLRLRTRASARFAALVRRTVPRLVPAFVSVAVPEPIRTAAGVLLARCKRFAVRPARRSSKRTVARSEVVTDALRRPARGSLRPPRRATAAMTLGAVRSTVAGAGVWAAGVEAGAGATGVVVVTGVAGAGLVLPPLTVRTGADGQAGAGAAGSWIRGAAKVWVGAGSGVVVPAPVVSETIVPLIGGVTSGTPSARATSRRPPEAIRIASVLRGRRSADAISSVRTSAGLSSGRWARTSAAAPETSGVAIDVPLSVS